MFDTLMVSLAVLIAIPILVLLVEVLAALTPPRRPIRQRTRHRPPVGILMPAHNESAVIEQTLSALMPHLRPGDQVQLIADNCTDETATLAARFPVNVIERVSHHQRGKGYALAHGLACWADAVPAVIVIMDADCRFDSGALDLIVSGAAYHNRPIQAVYLMDLPADPSPGDRISAFAFLFKNQVRPLGMHRLRQPCLLTGTGMAFPRKLLTPQMLATGNIVEDMQLGLDLAMQGHAPMLEPDALVWGQLPKQSDAVLSQRTRWEHGHLHTLVTKTPALLAAALRKRRSDLAALALELCVPPLSLLGMVWLVFSLLSSIHFWVTGTGAPLVIATATGMLLLAAVAAAWRQFGTEVLDQASLREIPAYALGKLGIYWRFMTQRQRNWIKTTRE